MRGPFSPPSPPGTVGATEGRGQQWVENGEGGGKCHWRLSDPWEPHHLPRAAKGLLFPCPPAGNTGLFSRKTEWDMEIQD